MQRTALYMAYQRTAQSNKGYANVFYSTDERLLHPGPDPRHRPRPRAGAGSPQDPGNAGRSSPGGNEDANGRPGYRAGEIRQETSGTCGPEGRSSRARHAAEARNCTVRADPPTLPYLSAGQSLAPLQGGLLASRSMTAPRSLAVVLLCAGFVLAAGA